MADDDVAAVFVLVIAVLGFDLVVQVPDDRFFFGER